MDHQSVAYVGFDTSKTKHAVAVAESGREGEVRYLGEIETTPAAVERLRADQPLRTTDIPSSTGGSRRTSRPPFLPLLPSSTPLRSCSAASHAHYEFRNRLQEEPSEHRRD